jgi:hypothetical protein
MEDVIGLRASEYCPVWGTFAQDKKIARCTVGLELGGMPIHMYIVSPKVSLRDEILQYL